MLFMNGRDYLIKTKHCQGRVNEEQVRKLATDLIQTLQQAADSSRQGTLVRFKRRGLDFTIHSVNEIHELKLSLGKDGLLYKTSSLCVKARGWETPLVPKGILANLDSKFNYSKVLEIANAPYGMPIEEVKEEE